MLVDVVDRVLDRRDLDSAGVYQVPLGCVLKRTHSESGMDVHYQGQTILKKHLSGGPSDAQYFTQEYLESLAKQQDCTIEIFQHPFLQV